ncbi:hypothetical protein CEXT_214791 [Caerostris extrusa]|uniref:Uncharacterized protein n=1 Tax=Caerostris extrusa TaxID=172846 RepID=A0AAV4YEC5_CAEEX|nr:hypothetical protein CEXT_214791 [Caerostris extrusa]
MRFEFSSLEWDKFPTTAIRSRCIVMQMEKCLESWAREAALQQQGHFDLKDPYQLVGNYREKEVYFIYASPIPTNKFHSPLNRELRNRQRLNFGYKQVLSRYDLNSRSLEMG